MAKGQVVEMVVDEVAGNLEEAAAVARSFDPKALKVLGLGLGVGLVVGFTVGYVWQRKKLANEAFSKSEAEVEKIRDLYKRNDQSFTVVRAQEKPDLQDVVEERGYSVRVEDEEIERPTRPPVPVAPAYSHLNLEGEPKRRADTEKDKYEGWDFEQELLDRRNGGERPYIIHQDEYFNKDSEYIQTTYTYYLADEVLVNEAEEKIDDPNELVGAANLERFGHGTDDWDVLYVRNDNARLDFEICRLHKSYEEEVLGIVHDITDDETDDGTD